MLIHECIYLINQYQSCIMCIFSQSSNSNLLILGVILYHDVLCISNYYPNIHVHLFPITFFISINHDEISIFIGLRENLLRKTLHSLMEKNHGFPVKIFPLVSNPLMIVQTDLNLQNLQGDRLEKPTGPTGLTLWWSDGQGNFMPKLAGIFKVITRHTSILIFFSETMILRFYMVF